MSMTINRTPSEVDIATALRKAITAADNMAWFLTKEGKDNPLVHEALTLLHEAKQMEATIHGINLGETE